MEAQRKHIRAVVRRVHPDLFEQHPFEQHRNTESLKTLNAYVDAICKGEDPVASTLQFYIKEGNKLVPIKAELNGSASLAPVFYAFGLITKEQLDADLEEFGTQDRNFLEFLRDTVCAAVQIGEEYEGLQQKIRDMQDDIRDDYNLDAVSVMGMYGESIAALQLKIEALQTFESGIADLYRQWPGYLDKHEVWVYHPDFKPQATRDPHDKGNGSESSFVGEDGLLHIVASDARTMIREVRLLNLARATELKAASQLRLLSEADLMQQLQQLLHVSTVFFDKEAGYRNEFCKWARQVLQQRTTFEQQLYDKTFDFQIYLHGEENAPDVEFLPTSALLLVKADSRPERLLDFLTSEAGAAADEKAAETRAKAKLEKELLEQVRVAFSAKLVIEVCSDCEKDSVIAAAQRLLDFAENIRGAVDLKGAKIAIHDCYKLWESGLISIPYNFHVADLKSHLRALLAPSRALPAQSSSWSSGSGQSFRDPWGVSAGSPVSATAGAIVAGSAAGYGSTAYAYGDSATRTGSSRFSTLDDDQYSWNASSTSSSSWRSNGTAQGNGYNSSSHSDNHSGYSYGESWRNSGSTAYSNGNGVHNDNDSFKQRNWGTGRESSSYTTDWKNDSRNNENNGSYSGYQYGSRNGTQNGADTSRHSSHSGSEYGGGYGAQNGSSWRNNGASSYRSTQHADDSNRSGYGAPDKSKYDPSDSYSRASSYSTDQTASQSSSSYSPRHSSATVNGTGSVSGTGWSYGRDGASTSSTEQSTSGFSWDTARGQSDDSFYARKPYSADYGTNGTAAPNQTSSPKSYGNGASHSSRWAQGMADESARNTAEPQHSAYSNSNGTSSSNARNTVPSSNRAKPSSWWRWGVDSASDTPADSAPVQSDYGTESSSQQSRRFSWDASDSSTAAPASAKHNGTANGTANNDASRTSFSWDSSNHNSSQSGGWRSAFGSGTADRAGNGTSSAAQHSTSGSAYLSSKSDAYASSWRLDDQQRDAKSNVVEPLFSFRHTAKPAAEPSSATGAPSGYGGRYATSASAQSDSAVPQRTWPSKPFAAADGTADRDSAYNREYSSLDSAPSSTNGSGYSDYNVSRYYSDYSRTASNTESTRKWPASTPFSRTASTRDDNSSSVSEKYNLWGAETPVTATASDSLWGTYETEAANPSDSSRENVWDRDALSSSTASRSSDLWGTTDSTPYTRSNGTGKSTSYGSDPALHSAAYSTGYGSNGNGTGKSTVYGSNGSNGRVSTPVPDTPQKAGFGSSIGSSNGVGSASYTAAEPATVREDKGWGGWPWRFRAAEPRNPRARCIAPQHRAQRIALCRPPVLRVVHRARLLRF